MSDWTTAESRRIPFWFRSTSTGFDLAELDRRRRRALQRPLPIWAVARFVAEAAEGLREVHQGGVVHCDVKPSNLFSSPQGAVKVGDFGVATAMGAGDDAAGGGTPWFMPPEQCRGRAVTARSDVYALGATAFALRYGEPPFAGTTNTRTKDQSARLPLRDPRKKRTFNT